MAAKERHRKKPSKKDGEKRREEKLRGRKRVVSENKAATAQKGKPLRHGKGLRGRLTIKNQGRKSDAQEVFL